MRIEQCVSQQIWSDKIHVWDVSSHLSAYIQCNQHLGVVVRFCKCMIHSIVLFYIYVQHDSPFNFNLACIFAKSYKRTHHIIQTQYRFNNIMHKGTETCVITSSEKTGNSSHIQDDSFHSEHLYKARRNLCTLYSNLTKIMLCMAFLIHIPWAMQGAY